MHPNIRFCRMYVILKNASYIICTARYTSLHIRLEMITSHGSRDISASGFDMRVMGKKNRRLQLWHQSNNLLAAFLLRQNWPKFHKKCSSSTKSKVA